MSILIYPLIADNSLSPTIISGVCKTIEKYLMIYRLDTLMKIGGWTPSAKSVQLISGVTATFITNYLATKYGGKSIVKALLNAGENIYDSSKLLLHESDKISGKELSSMISMYIEEKESITDRQKPPEVKSPMLNVSSTLDPTWTTIVGPQGTHIVGIKIAPFPISNIKDFVHQMLEDKSMKGIKKVIKATSRNFQRSFFYNIISRVSPILKFFGITMASLKGDPVNDILKGKSVFNETPFLLLNYNQIKDDAFFADAGGIDQLFAMGWQSVIAADDIAKRAIFCMKQFNGLCNVIPYSFVYSGLGRDAMNVYKDLEELRKSTAPYFSSKQSSKKFFSESYVKELVERYGSLNFPCLKGDCD